MNDLHLCLELFQSHVNHCVTFVTETAEIEAVGSNSKGLPVGNGLFGESNGHVINDAM